MKKLFNNRYAVTALVLGMAAFWAYQLESMVAPAGAVASLFRSEIAGEIAADIAGVEERLPLEVTALGNVDSMTPTAIVAVAQPARDPFAPPVANVAVTAVRIEDSVTPAASPLVVSAPALNALLAGPMTKLAIIDGQIVKPGDLVNGHQVTAISADSVTLEKLDVAAKIILRMPASE